MDPDAIPVRVLVVDDEHAIADSLAMILQMKGYATRTAYCGEDAVLLALDFRPHAVVSDLLMPGMSGVDLAVWFADHQPGAKVLLVSGQENALPVAEAAVCRGCSLNMASKPVHPEEILAFVAGCHPAA